ncbi:somatostatin-1A [Trichomycterus rosablanca]|uniref:somatostatin-1A n=1 Tax=Trichomycterus rosablanca TaxID=2290929 RepID=UPI002F35CA2C
MCSQLQVMVLVLSVLVMVGRIQAAPRTDLLTYLLENEPDENKDLSYILLLKLLSEMEIPGENNVLSLEDGEVKNHVLRQLPYTQRDRKAGCRNFFWKTFTSC